MHAGRADVSAAIGQILNLQISSGGAATADRALPCPPGGQIVLHAEYSGIESCTSANAQPDVQACHFGCLGFGDCVRACKFDALHIVDGLSTVDYHRCTGCGACQGLPAESYPDGAVYARKYDDCRMQQPRNGKTTRSFCQVGCIGCGICSKQSELFTVSDNLATLDYAAYTPSEATQRAMDKCPTGVIVYRGKTAPPPRQPKSTASASAT